MSWRIQYSYAARCAREMRLCPDGIMAQQTLYSIISLAHLCQGWNLHSGHGRCNWDIGSLIGHRDTNPDWGSEVLLFIQFTFEKESAEPPTKFKQLGWVGWWESGEKQIFYNYPENILQKTLKLGRRLEKWNLRLLFTSLEWKRFCWAGLKCEMVWEEWSC